MSSGFDICVSKASSQQGRPKAITFQPHSSFLASSMGVDKRAAKYQKNESKAHQTWTISLHTFSDMSHVLPTVFVYLLRESYVRGTQNATTKFRALQQQVQQILHNSPQPGPATFIVQCLYVLPILGQQYTEFFGHLVISRRLQTVPADLSEAQNLCAELVVDIIRGHVIYGETVLIKLLEAFNIRIGDIQKAICRGEVKDAILDMANTRVESFISRLFQSELYSTAVTLPERFSIRQPDQSFLVKMMEENHFSAAEKWATFMGKPMLCVLVQKYIDTKMIQKAYNLIIKNDLQEEFSEAYRMYKESSLKKLAEKGCWDVAEAKAHGNRQLLVYLVYLAMEAGYSEKVDEFCKRYSLEGFLNKEESETNPPKTRYLNLHDYGEDMVWVDDVDGLLNATSLIEKCKVVGVDCEWKPNYEKGSKPNKEASGIQLFSSWFLRYVGYNLQCDLKQLSHSYEKMECFRHYEMLLDIQNVFKEPNGGLSGLSEKILGAGLNKTRRNSNWEQRPLSQNQMEYAALDALVLVHIFRHVPNQTQNEGGTKLEWKSKIVPRLDYNLKRPKTEKKEGGTN